MRHLSKLKRHGHKGLLWLCAAIGLGAVAMPSYAAEGDPLLSAPVISAGTDHTCATIAGVAWCWGSNTYGQLGDGSTLQSDAAVMVKGLPAGTATAISAGREHTCAIVKGAAWCWGDNGHGQLGNGSTTDSAIPVQVTGLNSLVTAISAGTYHTCAIVNRVAKCWGGIGTTIALGNGSSTGSTTPVQVTGLASGVITISAGVSHTCATVISAAKCWGSNDYGELGNGTTTGSTTSVSVTGLSSGVTAIDAGSDYTCAIVSGATKCWGRNDDGQLGNSSYNDSTTPVSVTGLSSGATAISASVYHTCAIVSGAAKCWGWNTNGQLGNDGYSSSAPVSVTGLSSGVTVISAGSFHTCAIAVNGGSARCWGSNEYGQLGNGNTMDASSPSIVVKGE